MLIFIRKIEYFKHYSFNFDKILTALYLCRLVSDTINCVMRNSSNCHPASVHEIQGLLRPGMLSANYNCSVLAQVYESYTVCPIIGNCSIAMAMEKITEAVAQSTTTGSPCR